MDAIRLQYHSEWSQTAPVGAAFVSVTQHKMLCSIVVTTAPSQCVVGTELRCHYFKSCTSAILSYCYWHKLGVAVLALVNNLSGGQVCRCSTGAEHMACRSLLSLGQQMCICPEEVRAPWPATLGDSQHSPLTGFRLSLLHLRPNHPSSVCRAMTSLQALRTTI